MIVAPHQPAYLPWLGYFHKLSLCDLYVYFDHVDKSKQDFTNRNKIKTLQGPIWLTVPLLKSESKRICDLSIDPRVPWQKSHLTSIQNNYSKSEYFKNYFEDLQAFYAKGYENFSDMNFEYLQLLTRLLGMPVECIRSRDLGVTLQKNEGIYQLLEKVGGSKIVFGQNGVDYVDVEQYKEQGFDVYFQKYTHPIYPQLFGQFEPCLSVLDLLFNCGPASLSILLSGNAERSTIFR